MADGAATAELRARATRRDRLVSALRLLVLGGIVTLVTCAATTRPAAVLLSGLPSWSANRAPLTFILLLSGGLGLAAVHLRRRSTLRRSRISLAHAMAELAAAGEQLAVANDRARRAVGLARLHTRLLQSRDRALQLHNARFDAALNNMSQALYMADASQRVIVCNRRFREMFGLSPEDTSPGAGASDLFDAVRAAGRFDASLIDRLQAEQNAFASRPAARSFVVEDAAAERALAVSLEPMRGGGCVATYEDVSERRQAEARVRHLANHDGLTNLPNRRVFRERLDAELAALADRGESIALFCLDLDYFKHINDTLGHAAGDMLLALAAARLRGCAREGDIVARLGGDEFAILRRGLGQPAQAEALARRVCAAIRQPFDLAGKAGHVGVSIGIALAEAPGMDADLLLKNADIALFQAKAEGRNSWRFYAAEMDAQIQERRAIEADLREALARAQFELVYQPQFDLRTSSVVGFEALLRWRHPERGLIPPAQFIPLAEQLLMIGPIGEWVLERSCADAASWPEHVRVAVNLSPVQLRDGDLVGAVMRALSQSKLAPARLELEITETALLQETASVIATLHRLRGLGISVALDDFGTGYSSLSYLRSFPFDRLKIDQSFVRELGRRPDCRVIVTTVASLAHQLGMSTTAEGVEMVGQVRELRQAGCTEAQGFHLGAPVPLAETLRWFAPAPGETELASA